MSAKKRRLKVKEGDTFKRKVSEKVLSVQCTPV